MTKNGVEINRHLTESLITFYFQKKMISVPQRKNNGSKFTDPISRIREK